MLVEALLVLRLLPYTALPRRCVFRIAGVVCFCQVCFRIWHAPDSVTGTHMYIKTNTFELRYDFNFNSYIISLLSLPLPACLSCYFL